MTYSCAYCGATAYADTGCAICGRDPDADAVEVARRDAEITSLIGQLAAARRAVEDLDRRIGHAWERRNAADARVRAAARAATANPARRSRIRLWPGALIPLVLAFAAEPALRTLRTARPAFHAAWQATVPPASWPRCACFAAAGRSPWWRPWWRSSRCRCGR